MQHYLNNHNDNEAIKKTQIKKNCLYQPLVVVATKDHLPLAKATAGYAWFILNT